MSGGSACNCCDSPPKTRIAIQFVSFDRACSNSCFFDVEEDWLIGPFHTIAICSGSVNLNNEDEDSGSCRYTSFYNRTTTAQLKLDPSQVGFSAVFPNGECPCSSKITETTSSFREEVCTFPPLEGETVGYQTTVYMSCEGGGTLYSDEEDKPIPAEERPTDCVISCPPYLDIQATVLIGASTAERTVEGFIHDRFPENNYENITNYDCGNFSNCPVPPPFSGGTSDGSIYPIEEEAFYSGPSAQCTFEVNEISYPEFPTITKLDPYNTGSGFQQNFSSNLPENQGYLKETYRFARGSGGRFKDQSEQHVKWRVVHNPTITCHLRVWFVIKRTITINNAPPEDSRLGTTIVEWIDVQEPYIWNAPPSELELCVEENKAYYESIICGNEMEMELPQPDIDQREYGISEEIFIKKVSIINGYEPENPPETSQYGFQSQDVIVGSENCIGCEAKSWSCPYFFAQHLTGCQQNE